MIKRIPAKIYFLIAIVILLIGEIITPTLPLFHYAKADELPKYPPRLNIPKSPCIYNDIKTTCSCECLLTDNNWKCACKIAALEKEAKKEKKDPIPPPGPKCPDPANHENHVIRVEDGWILLDEIEVKEEMGKPTPEEKRELMKMLQDD